MALSSTKIVISEAEISINTVIIFKLRNRILEFKDGCKLFWYQFPTFFVFGLLLLFGFELYEETTQQFLSDIFFEHFAVKSIILIFLSCLFVSGIFLLFIGQKEEQNKLHSYLYDYVVRPPIELGITLSSIVFSLSVSLIIILLFVDLQKALELAFSSFSFILMAIFYWSLSVLVLENSYLTSRKERALVGLLMIIGVPFLAWWVIPTLA